MNNDRPDIVILHPRIGIQIIEVKDWNPIYYRSEPEIYKDPKTNKWRKWIQFFVLDKQGVWQPIKNPISQVSRYRRNLIDLYMPNLGEKVDENRKALAALSISIYFHKMTTLTAQELLKHETRKRCIVIGNDYLTPQSLKWVVPDTERNSSYVMKEELAEQLRVWLNPPFHALEQGKPLELNKQQTRYAKPTPGKRQLLCGVAGSGKTLVVAQRAAQVAAEGKNVLVLTFNITLWHYVRDHVQRAGFGFKWTNIEIRHFHDFCWAYFDENDISDERPDKTFDDDYYRIFVPEKLMAAKKGGQNAANRNYDAILIDEGQDFNQLWYEALCLFLTRRGQVLLVIDERQNIYENNLNWTFQLLEQLPELKESYRLPDLVIAQAYRFAKTFSLKGSNEIVQHEFSVDKPIAHLVWQEISSFDEAKGKNIPRVQIPNGYYARPPTRYCHPCS